jgi:dihydroorotate dehydrogenase electron transfer subunit
LASACTDLEVVSIKRLGAKFAGDGIYELTLSPPEWKSWRPGQFVMLRPETFGRELIWGRPFSIASLDENGLKVFFQHFGRGTGLLSEAEPGDSIAVWGPLGNGFKTEPDTPTLVLAGGIGIASFMGYIHEHPKPENLLLVFGHTAPYECYPCAGLGGRVRTEAFFERGPEDLKKFIALLEERIAEYAEGLVLACGPLPFLKTVGRITGDRGVRAQLSLENRMGCGVGACMGCVTRHKDAGYVNICTRGPVFWADELDLENA